MANIVYRKVKQPKLDCTNIPVQLSDETMKERIQKVLTKMSQENYDTLVIYADLEHGNNFEYLTGFLPRFEEALLVINKDSKNYMIMGNENLNKVSKSRIESLAVHAPYFSLPNQPMDNKVSFKEILESAELKEGKKTGIVGWKNFTSAFEDNAKLYDVPYYVVDTIISIVGKDNVDNATRLFIGEKGVRCTNNPHDIEPYEFGASLAGD